jgi:chromosome partitioning protein
MAKVISVINLKGGVAKTTTTVQLAECMADEFGKKVLVIDLDPQTNATIALIGEERWETLDENKQTLFHLFNDKLNRTHEFKMEDAIQRGVSNLQLSRLSLLPSSIKLIDIQDRIEDIANKTNFSINPMEVLKSAIHPHLGEYDYVLIDCPPNLGFITQNGIEISDYYLIPTVPDKLSTYGIPQIIKKINDLSSWRNLQIKCLGLIITKYVSISSVHSRTIEDMPARMKRYSQELNIGTPPIFKTVMPQANSTAEVMDFDKKFNTFNQKHGYSQAAGVPLHHYVTNLTKEFLLYAGQ